MKQKVVHFSKLAALMCLFLVMCGATALAQNRGITIKGNIVDVDGLPVIGAAVTIQGTTTGRPLKKVLTIYVSENRIHE